MGAAFRDTGKLYTYFKSPDIVSRLRCAHNLQSYLHTLAILDMIASFRYILASSTITYNSLDAFLLEMVLFLGSFVLFESHGHCTMSEEAREVC